MVLTNAPSFARMAELIRAGRDDEAEREFDGLMAARAKAKAVLADREETAADAATVADRLEGAFEKARAKQQATARTRRWSYRLFPCMTRRERY